MDIPSEINAVEQEDNGSLVKVNPGSFRGEIEFQDVWFRYPTRKSDWILKGLNLKINAQETVALVGESGCGKSTIVSLILRFYDVNSGRILIDGVDIKNYKLEDLRSIMGLVMQEPTLFNYTITENILYGKNTATNTEIREAASVSNALEFIESNKVSTFDDSAEVLLREMKRNENDVKKVIGDKEY
jgi:ATP-binding cassette, subfamily B (MDR/TAP), member 1